MWCHLHFAFGAAPWQTWAPAVGDMWCHLHLGRPSGRPGAPAVGDRWCHLHLGLKGEEDEDEEEKRSGSEVKI